MKLPTWYVDFWRGPEIRRIQLTWFRLLFFALLAVDAFLLIGHAPRHGSGGFNVPHFPSIAFITPVLDRTAVVVCALVLCYLASRIAIGVAARWLFIPVVALYASVYLSSQLDSYQHHYLLVLMLIAATTIDWRAEKPAGAGLRLLLLLVSVVYFFAAISKMEAAWWDGRALEATIAQLPPSFAADAIKSVGFAAMAKLTVLTELFLAFAIHVPFLRLPAALIGIGLHVSIELAGFQIGLFSYYMVAFYLLILPPAAFRWSELKLRPRSLPGPAIAYLAGAAAVGFALIATLPLDGTIIAALVITVAMIGREKRVAIAHVSAIVAVLICANLSDAIRDHYRFWGGSSRRLGDRETAKKAYERLADYEPEYASGRRNLGRIYVAEGRLEEALVEYKAAERSDPDTIASQIGLANVYAKLGRGHEAVRHAVKVRELAARDANTSSRGIQQALRQAAAIERRFADKL